MLYALLVYEKPTDFAQRDAIEANAYIGAWRNYYQAMVEAGVRVDGGNPLDGPETATTLRLRDSKRDIQDGPYAGTKEQLGGIVLLDVPSLDAALDWVARCPAASYGAVEVRPIDTEAHRRIVGEHASR